MQLMSAVPWTGHGAGNFKQNPDKFSTARIKPLMEFLPLIVIVWCVMVIKLDQEGFKVVFLSLQVFSLVHIVLLSYVNWDQ